MDWRDGSRAGSTRCCTLLPAELTRAALGEPRRESRRRAADLQSRRQRLVARIPASSGLYRAERERHRPIDDNLAADTRDPFELSHPAAQPLHARFYLHDIAGMHWMPVAHPIDAHEENQLLAIFRLREDQDGADLRHGLCKNRRRQRRYRPWLTREVPLVQ